MASVHTIRTSFVGGEVSPELYGRMDVDKEQSGLALCQNFVVLPHGPVQSRAGSRYVATVKKTNLATRLIPFSFNSSQTIAIELGAGYFRFHALEGTILGGANTLNAEMMLNPFFTTDLSNWTSLCSAGGAVMQMTTLDFGTGQNYPCVSMLATAGSGAVAMLSQAIATVPGQTYDVSLFGWNDVWLFVDSAAPTAAMGLTGGNLLNMEFTGGATNAMNGYGATFTATTSTSYIRLGSNVSRRDAAVSVRLSVSGIPPFNLGTAYSVGNLVHDAFGNIYVCVQSSSTNQFYNPAYFTKTNGATPATYVATTAYSIGNAVSYGGVNYYCIAPTTGNLPTNTAYWLIASASAYEVSNGYNAVDLFAIHYVQSGDIVTFVHPAYPPMQLERLGNVNWQFVGISFAASITPPATPTVAVTRSTTGYPVNRSYIVTALDQYGQEESLPSSASALAANDLTIDGNYNTVSWAGFYNVYCQDNGSFGFVGQVQAPALSFVDHNITPDQTQSYPLIDSPVPLSSTGNYPAAVGYYEQRRVFAGTNNQPQNLWLTQPGTESNLNYSVPSQGSDALRIRIAALRANFIAAASAGFRP